MDLHAPPAASPAAGDRPAAEAAEKVSAAIGCEEFVDRVLDCLTRGARKAVEENAALPVPPKKP
jgi:hypothetical protein